METANTLILTGLNSVKDFAGKVPQDRVPDFAMNDFVSFSWLVSALWRHRLQPQTLSRVLRVDNPYHFAARRISAFALPLTRTFVSHSSRRSLKKRR
jgi:hypothetical protein